MAVPPFEEPPVADPPLVEPPFGAPPLGDPLVPPVDEPAVDPPDPPEEPPVAEPPDPAEPPSLGSSKSASLSPQPVARSRPSTNERKIPFTNAFSLADLAKRVAAEPRGRVVVRLDELPLG